MNKAGAGILILVAALMAGAALRRHGRGEPPVRRSLTVGLWVASAAALAVAVAVVLRG